MPDDYHSFHPGSSQECAGKIKTVHARPRNSCCIFSYPGVYGNTPYICRFIWARPGRTQSMKIVTWNCNMAFRKKAEMVLRHNPDIVVVPECEHPHKLSFNPKISNPTDVLWFGVNQNKGLGIFSYSDYKLKLLDEYNPDFKIVAPIFVTRKRSKLILYAIWANNPTDREGHYITQVWKAINYYDSLLKNRRTLLIGDFNSNTIWDRPRREGNHSTVVSFLEKREFTVRTIIFTNSHRAKSNIRLYTCTDK